MAPHVDRVTARPGRPLDEQTRAFMEPRFGFSFGSVRVHADADAAASAAAAGARAYTVGDHVVLAEGAYAPGAPGGRELLAHELAHVVQQRERGAAWMQRQPAPNQYDRGPTSADARQLAEYDLARQVLEHQ